MPTSICACRVSIRSVAGVAVDHAMGIGLFAPPFGVGYYAACAISRIHPNEGMKPIVGYMVALFIGTVLVAAIPWISIGFL